MIMKSKQLYFNIDIPNFLKEIQGNSTLQQSYVMRAPMEIMKTKLALITKRASELNDPKLNILMLETKLYEVENHEDIPELIKQQEDRISRNDFQENPIESPKDGFLTGLTIASIFWVLLFGILCFF
jgi:hypothetical protein